MILALDQCSRGKTGHWFGILSPLSDKLQHFFQFPCPLLSCMNSSPSPVLQKGGQMKIHCLQSLDILPNWHYCHLRNSGRIKLRTRGQSNCWRQSYARGHGSNTICSWESCQTRKCISIAVSSTWTNRASWDIQRCSGAVIFAVA